MTQWQPGTADTVNGVLERAVSNFGADPYLDFQGTVYSYEDIDRESTRLAHGLAALGVREGDTVASILDNNVDAVLTWFAVNKLNAISVPVNTAYKREFLRHQLVDSGARIVIAEGDYAQRVTGIADQLPHVTHLLHRGENFAETSVDMAIMPLENVAMDGDAVFPTPGAGDLCMLIYTSGTTGPSKGCMISHGYACSLARQAMEAVGLVREDIFWTALPLFHMNATAATVLSTAMIGARANIYPRFSVSNFWADVERSGATVGSLLGSMQSLLAEAPEDPAMLRCFGQLRTVAASPFPADLQEKWRRRFGVKVMGAPGYGLTEAALLTGGPLAERKNANSSGRCMDDFEIVIVDDEDREVPTGTSGEVICRPRAPFVMFNGYWNRPADTLKIMRNMWLHTGDIGKFDENGEFHFVDRKKDYLRRRGENISSAEMEATFQNHPDIVDVAVHAVLSDVGEDDVKVTCVLQPRTALTEEALCAWAIDHVPYFAVPRYIEFRADLPRNPTGKILKYQLRDEGCTPATWDREKSDMRLVKR